jgi:hypothetical protein
MEVITLLSRLQFLSIAIYPVLLLARLALLAAFHGEVRSTHYTSFGGN